MSQINPMITRASAYNLGAKNIEAMMNQKDAQHKLLWENPTAQRVLSRSGAGGTTGSMTNQFLSQWGQINESVLGSLSKLSSGIGTTNKAIEDTLAQIKAQADEYENRYGGLEEDAIAAARADLANKRELTQQLMGFARPDYEGVKGRAATDVTGAAESARAGQAREMISLGIDPTSGKFGNLTRKSFMDEARDKVIAMNLARRGEKERAAGATTQAMGAINPSESAGIATGIDVGRQRYSGLTGDLAKASADYNLNATKLKAGITGQIADIGRDYGSAGLTLKGIEMGQNTDNNSSSSTSTTPPYMTGNINLGRISKNSYGAL